MADGTERKRESPTRWSNGRNASLALTSVHGDRFGPVTKMIGLASSLNKVDGPNWPSLEQLMRIGLIKRGNPVYDSSGDLTGPSGYLTGPSCDPIFFVTLYFITEDLRPPEWVSGLQD